MLNFWWRNINSSFIQSKRLPCFSAAAVLNIVSTVVENINKYNNNIYITIVIINYIIIILLFILLFYFLYLFFNYY